MAKNPATQQRVWRHVPAPEEPKPFSGPEWNYPQSAGVNILAAWKRDEALRRELERLMKLEEKR